MTPEPEDLRRERLVARLWEEFHRLNAEHFGGALALGEIRVSTRKQYGGYYRPDSSRIVVSWRAHEEHGWEETIQTFRHEVAHIVHPNHSPAFWALARRLGCTRRYALPPKERPHAYLRYVYECPACKARVFRRRRIARAASCARCDKAFNPAFRLRLIKDEGRAANQPGPKPTL